MRKPAAAKTTSAAPAKRAAPAAAKPATKPAAKAAATKPAAKAAVKPAAKPAAKPPAKPAAKSAPVKPPAKVAKQAAPPPPKAARKGPAKGPAPVDNVREKAKKARLVRDSFTMPEHEYEVIGQVKKSCLKAGFEIKKSELLRIGVALISQLDLATLQNVLASLPQLKTGRPKKT
jgi:hypothetical protein